MSGSSPGGPTWVEKRRPNTERLMTSSFGIDACAGARRAHVARVIEGLDVRATDELEARADAVDHRDVAADLRDLVNELRHERVDGGLCWAAWTRPHRDRRRRAALPRRVDGDGPAYAGSWTGPVRIALPPTTSTRRARAPAQQDGSSSSAAHRVNHGVLAQEKQAVRGAFRVSEQVRRDLARSLRSPRVHHDVGRDLLTAEAIAATARPFDGCRRTGCRSAPDPGEHDLRPVAGARDDGLDSCA